MRCAIAFLVVCWAVTALASDVQRGSPLPRKGFLGLQTVAASGALKVVRVVPGGAAAKLDLKTDDILISVNGRKLTQPAQLVSLAHTLNGGAALSLQILRDGRQSSVEGTIPERPRAVEPDLDVIYDQVVSQGKRIRVIITKPKGAGIYPALFLIGGIGAYSLDAPFASMPYGNVIAPIAHAGYVTVRIDKPGQGDSEGPAAYKDLTFKAELDAYVQALRLAKTLEFVDPQRIAIFGHSMGGCFGPLVADVEPVKALAVCGTLFKSFHEYMLENTRRQAELGGASADQLDQSLRQLAEVMNYIFAGDETPRSVMAKHKDLSAFVKSTFADLETYSGVGIPFFRELSRTNLPQVWSGAKADVLVLYAENDFLSGRDDHERIAAYVNKLRPGTARFLLLEGMDHGFTKTTSMLDSMQRWGKGGEFNPKIVDVLEDFLKKELG